MARINGTSAKNNYGFYALLTETLGTNYLNTNTTTVKYKVYIVNVNARTESGNWTFNAKIDGSNVYNKTGQTLKTNDTDYNKPKLVFSGSKDVKHENNGSKKITFSASLTKSTAYSLYDPGKCSLSGNFTLTTIPRASTIEAVSGYIGETTTLYIGRKSDSFTEKLTWSCENLSGTIENLNNETNVPFTIPTSLYALIPDDKQIDVTISCITYNGETQVGEEQTTTLKARVDENENKPIINEPIITETNTRVSNLTNKLVLNASRPKITINASGQNSASIKSIITTNKDGQSYTGDEVVFNTIGTAKFTIDVTDTRDLPNSKQIDKTEEAIPYVQPNIKTISIDRLSPTSGEIILSLIGSFYKGYIDNTENELNISYRYKENVTNATWSDLIRVPNNSIDFDTTNNSYSLTNFSLGQITQYNKQYVFEIYYSDVLVTDAKPLTRAVKKGVPTFDYGEHDLKVNGDLFVADEDGLNKINILDKIKELQSGDIDLSDYATKKELEDYAKSADLSTVATTGKYYDLLDEPTKISSFENDKGYITGYTETDPTVPSHVKNITSGDITKWNNKSNFSGSYNDLTNKPTIPIVENNLTSSSTTNALSAAQGKDLQEQIDATNEEFGMWMQGVTNMVAEKQDKLVSGTNIKTINGESLLGSGDITIEGGSGGGSTGTVLYENSAGTNAGITLSQSTATMSALEIYFGNATADTLNYIKIDSPKGKMPSLVYEYVNKTTGIVNRAGVMLNITRTALTAYSYYTLEITSSGQTFNTSTNGIYIRKVIGYV